MVLIVCPADSVADVCRTRSPSHVVSLASPGGPLPEIAAGPKRLVLAFNDVAGPSAGLVAPEADAVAAILAFGRGWTGERPLLVHCEAGVSRSTAAAFALACQAAPQVPEWRLARALRSASPVATPNSRVIALADAQLEREGRMIASVAALGRGAEYAPYTSFDLLPLSSHARPE